MTDTDTKRLDALAAEVASLRVLLCEKIGEPFVSPRLLVELLPRVSNLSASGERTLLPWEDCKNSSDHTRLVRNPLSSLTRNAQGLTRFSRDAGAQVWRSADEKAGQHWQVSTRNHSDSLYLPLERTVEECMWLADAISQMQGYRLLSEEEARTCGWTPRVRAETA